MGHSAMTCEARQYSDSMRCARCGLAWDANDPEPPKCVTVADKALKDCYTALSAAKRNTRQQIAYKVIGILNYGGWKK